MCLPANASALQCCSAGQAERISSSCSPVWRGAVRQLHYGQLAPEVALQQCCVARCYLSMLRGCLPRRMQVKLHCCLLSAPESRPLLLR